MIPEILLEYDVPAGMLTLLLLIFQEIYIKDKRPSTRALMHAEAAVCVYAVCRAYSVFLRVDGRVDEYRLVVLANLLASIAQAVAVFFVFLFFLRLTSRQVDKKLVLACAIPLLVFVAFLLVPPLRDHVYVISSRSEYVSGPWSWIGLLYAAVYVVMIIVTATIHQDDFQNRYAAVVALGLFLLLANYIDYRFATRIDTFVLALCLTAFVTILDAESYDMLQKISLYDELSGLKNRYSLLRDFDKLQGEDICLAIMDIDDFKRFNDTYGHVAGDKVIQLTGATLRRFFDGQSYRYGGDEFIVMTKLAPPAFSKRMEDLRLAIADQPLDGIADHVTLSYGKAYAYVDDGARLTRIINSADENLYHWKKVRKARAKYQLPLE